jgi:hypothetical protein
LRLENVETEKKKLLYDNVEKLRHYNEEKEKEKLRHENVEEKRMLRLKKRMRRKRCTYPFKLHLAVQETRVS